MESLFLTIQRGFDNVLANWPLLLIRVAENVAMIVVVLFIALGGILPLVLFGAAFAETLQQIDTPDRAAELILQYPLIVLYVLLVISVAVLAAVLVHSFVQGGVVGCYLAGEKNAGDQTPMERRRFRAFSPESWFRDSRRNWWSVFWIYNITWGIFSLILLVPLILLAIALFAARESPEIVALACGGAALLFLLMVIAGVVTHFWATAAVIVTVEGRGIVASLREGWSIAMRRFLVFLTLMLIAFLVSIAAIGSIAAASIGIGILSSVPGMGLLTIPFQVAISLLQTAVSIALEAWFLAACVTVVLRS